MNNYKYLICLMILITSACSDTLPTRSECISEIVFSMPKTFSEQDVEVLSKKILMLTMKKQDNYLPLGGFTYPSLESPKMYFQFKSKCQRKGEFVHMLLDNADIPPFNLTNNVIYPSPSTIAINGPSWSDGMNEISLDVR